MVFTHDYAWFAFVILAVGGVVALSALVRVRLPFRAFPRFCRCLATTPAYLAQAALYLLAVVLVFIATQGPQQRVLKNEPIREGMSVVASIDCSLSMLARIGAQDSRTRLSVVLESVHAVFRSLPDDKKGAVCFAQEVVSTTTLTTDYSRVLMPQIEEITEHYIATVGSGTSFAAALDGCLRVLNFEDPRRKVCIILSDGEPQGDEQFLRRKLQKKVNEVRVVAAQHGTDIRFYLVGVGDPGAAFKIPRKDARGNFAGFVCCDENGNVIETRPSPLYLKSIARTVGGDFVHIKSAAELVDVIGEIIVAERKVLRYRPVVESQDRSDRFFIGAIIALVAALFFPKHMRVWRRVWRREEKHR